MRQSTVNGYILYDGPSMIDGEPIVAIATGFKRPSANPKTGPMIQTWIIRSDMRPATAINEGADESICGQCPMKGWIEQRSEGTVNRGRSCYVAVQNAPTGVYDGYLNNSYEVLEPRDVQRLFRWHRLRLGAYGDPVAVPFPIWSSILKNVQGHTGYTHQWREPRFWRFKQILMASVETETEAKIAQAKGWRTFRSRPVGTPLAEGEIECPASEKMGYRTTCDHCLHCDGATNKRKFFSIAIEAHGGKGVLSNYDKMISTK